MFLFSTFPEASDEIQEEVMKIFAEIVRTQFRENIDVCSVLLTSASATEKMRKTSYKMYS